MRRRARTKARPGGERGEEGSGGDRDRVYFATMIFMAEPEGALLLAALIFHSKKRMQTSLRLLRHAHVCVKGGGREGGGWETRRVLLLLLALMREPLGTQLLRCT